MVKSDQWQHTIQGLDETADHLERQIKDTRKRITDLTAQCGQPFEYADKPSSLLQRQQQIASDLDLTKNQASSQLEAEQAENTANNEAAVESLREIGFGDF